MVKKAKILIQSNLRERLTFPSGEGNLSSKRFWIKRLALLAICNCRFYVKFIDKHSLISIFQLQTINACEMWSNRFLI